MPAVEVDGPEHGDVRSESTPAACYRRGVVHVRAERFSFPLPRETEIVTCRRVRLCRVLRHRAARLANSRIPRLAGVTGPIPGLSSFCGAPVWTQKALSRNFEEP